MSIVPGLGISDIMMPCRWCSCGLFLSKSGSFLSWFGRWNREADCS